MRRIITEVPRGDDEVMEMTSLMTINKQARKGEEAGRLGGGGD